MQVLIIITRREGENEFAKFWGQPRNISHTIYPLNNNINSQNKLLILVDGKKFENKIDSGLLYIQQELSQYYNIQGVELGIIIHDSVLFTRIKQLFKHSNLKFIKKYSSSNDKDDAILKELKNNLQNNEFEDRFNTVWKYFDYDEVLEASLEFLHKSNNSQKFESVNDDKKYDLIKEKINDVLKKDSNLEFETKLILLRDTLLSEVQ